MRLNAGELLGVEECVSELPVRALAEARKQRRLSYKTRWVRQEHDRFDRTVKDMVRRELGRPTSTDRKDKRRLRRLRRRRALERRNARQRPCENDRRALAFVCSGTLNPVNERYARSLLAAHTAGRARRTFTARRRGPARTRSRTRSARPRRTLSCRRSARSTRAGPGSGASDGGPGEHTRRRPTSAAPPAVRLCRERPL